AAPAPALRPLRGRVRADPDARPLLLGALPGRRPPASAGDRRRQLNARPRAHPRGRAIARAALSGLRSSAGVAPAGHGSGAFYGKDGGGMASGPSGGGFLP